MQKVKINRKFLVRAQKALKQFGRDNGLDARYYSAIREADENLPYFVNGFTNEAIVELTLPDSVIERLRTLKPLVERLGFSVVEDLVVL
jgi:citrate lyase alpha subunit